MRFNSRHDFLFSFRASHVAYSYIVLGGRFEHQSDVLAFDLFFGLFRFFALSLTFACASLACFCAARNFAFLLGFFLTEGFLSLVMEDVLFFGRS